MKLTLSRSESLKSRKLIDKLFKEGKTLRSELILVNYMVVESSRRLQVAFAVPKRKFRNAVDRNHIKRQLRESFRKNKTIISEPLKIKGIQIAVMVVYIGNTAQSSEIIAEKIIVILERLRDNILLIRSN